MCVRPQKNLQNKSFRIKLMLLKIDSSTIPEKISTTSERRRALFSDTDRGSSGRFGTRRRSKKFWARRP
jgi:hypothetical protein